MNKAVSNFPDEFDQLPKPNSLAAKDIKEVVVAAANAVEESDRRTVQKGGDSRGDDF